MRNLTSLFWSTQMSNVTCNRLEIPNVYSSDPGNKYIQPILQHYTDTLSHDFEYVDDIRLHVAIISPFSRPTSRHARDIVIYSTNPLIQLWLFDTLNFVVDTRLDDNDYNMHVALINTPEDDDITEFTNTVRTIRRAQRDILKDELTHQCITHKCFWIDNNAYVSNKVIDLFRRMTINVFDTDGNVIA